MVWEQILATGKPIFKKAVESIIENIGPVVHFSSVYETEPWGFRSEDLFLNMVAEVETNLKPSGLLGRILMIEANMGRLRERKRIFFKDH